MSTHEPKPESIGEMPPEDQERIAKVLRGIGGRDVTWGARSYLDVWITERRMASEREASRRLERATWALAIVTLVLALATIALVYATVAA